MGGAARNSRLIPGLLLLLVVSCVSAGRGPIAAGEADGGSAASTRSADLSAQAVLLQLADRQFYEPWIVDRLAGEAAPIRRALATALGRIGDSRGRPTLESLLADADPRVRREAAFGLGLLGDRAAEGALARAAADADAETGRLAVDALARIGVSLARVRAALQPVEGARDRQQRLLPGLFRFPDDAVVEVARAALNDDDPELHRWAAYALAREPRAAARSELRQLLGDPDPLVRKWASRALGRVGDGGDLGLLRPLLRDSDPGPVIETLRAGRALVERGEVAPDPAWAGELRRLLEDPRPGVRVTAIEAAAGWLLDGELGSALTARARRGTARERALALLALAEGGDGRARALVGPMASDDDITVRAAAATAAVLLEDRVLLLRLREDPAIPVRLAAITSALERGAGASAEWIGRGLGDASWIVQAAVFEWLEEHPELAVETLLAAAEAAADAQVWAAAIPAVAARAAAVTGERSSAAEALQELAEGSEFLVRRAAVTALEELKAAAPAATPLPAGKPLATYREIVLQTRERPIVVLETSRGTMRLQLACPQAPLTCLNFLHLARQGYFDGVRFHRVVPDFVAQGGDPTGTGWGGPGYAIRDEVNRLPYGRGAVGMALGGPDTGASQFFITLSPQPHLDGRYTLFAHVVDGMEVADEIVQGDVIERAFPATFTDAPRSTR